MVIPGKEKATTPAPIDKQEFLCKLEALMTSSTLPTIPSGEVSRALVAFVDALISSGSEPQQPQSHSSPQTGPTEEHDGLKATEKNLLVEILNRWSVAPDDEKMAWHYLYEKTCEVCANDMTLDKGTNATQTNASSIQSTALNTEAEHHPESEADGAKVAGGSWELGNGAREGDARDEEVVRGPSLTPHEGATTAVRENSTRKGNLKRTFNSVAVTTTSHVTADTTAKAQPKKRRRGRPKKVVVEEQASLDDVPTEQMVTPQSGEASGQDFTIVLGIVIR